MLHDGIGGHEHHAAKDGHSLLMIDVNIITVAMFDLTGFAQVIEIL